MKLKDVIATARKTSSNNPPKNIFTENGEMYWLLRGLRISVFKYALSGTEIDV